MNDEIELLKARLANTEAALIALHSLLQDTIPLAYNNDISTMLKEYFEANNSLGADFDSRNGFIVKPD